MANALKLPVDEPSRWVGRVNRAGGGGGGLAGLRARKGIRKSRERKELGNKMEKE